MKINQITEEDLKQLNQLDRVEFRQKYEKIKSEEPKSGVIPIFNYYLAACGYILLLFWIISSQDLEIAHSILSLIIPLSKTFIILGIFVLFYDIFEVLSWSKKKQELFQEYFNLNLTKKVEKKK